MRNISIDDPLPLPVPHYDHDDGGCGGEYDEDEDGVGGLEVEDQPMPAV